MSVDQIANLSGEPDSGRSSQIAHLYIMLTIFFGIFLILLVIQLLRSGGPGGVVSATQAHSPSEFSEVFDSRLLKGLDAFGEESGEAKHIFDVPLPPFSEDIFPCTECHPAGDEDDVDPEPREFDDDHSDIVLSHGEKPGWCYMCHSPENRDALKLADGTQVPFTESYRLCGQCHGTEYRDWRAGVHGRRMGRWDGHKRYLLCAHCHNPHAPAFKPLKPLPPPSSWGAVERRHHEKK
ncbi:MAG: hypothetical protein ACYS47_01750 [Planctomycetota bacterium]|jgi:hypothetical protein